VVAVLPPPAARGLFLISAHDLAFPSPVEPDAVGVRDVPSTLTAELSSAIVLHGRMTPTEKDLAERLRRRDQAAFHELVSRYEHVIHRFVSCMVGDPALADDLTQEVFVTAFQRAAEAPGDEHLATWLYRIASALLKAGRRGARA
jgi:hypothetical protein